jgi:hypothetical protein
VLVWAGRCAESIEAISIADSERPVALKEEAAR